MLRAAVGNARKSRSQIIGELRRRASCSATATQSDTRRTRPAQQQQQQRREQEQHNLDARISHSAVYAKRPSSLQASRVHPSFFDTARLPVQHPLLTPAGAGTLRQAGQVDHAQPSASTSKMPPASGQRELCPIGQLAPDTSATLRCLIRLERAMERYAQFAHTDHKHLERLGVRAQTLRAALQHAELPARDSVRTRLQRVLSQAARSLRACVRSNSRQIPQEAETMSALARVLIELHPKQDNQGQHRSGRGLPLSVAQHDSLAGLALAHAIIASQSSDSAPATRTEALQLARAAFLQYSSSQRTPSAAHSVLRDLLDVLGIETLLGLLDSTQLAALAENGDGGAVLTELISVASDNEAVLKQLGAIIGMDTPRAVFPPRPSPGGAARDHKIQHLHRALFRESLIGGCAPSSDQRVRATRLYGPAKHQVEIFSALQYLLSAILLRDDSEAHVRCMQGRSGRLNTAPRTSFQAHRFDAFRDLLRSLRHEYRLPPDRQVVAAVLRAHRKCDEDQVTALQPYLQWLWQEWTLLRENDPSIPGDDVILVGFLEALGAGESKHVETWENQALEMAIIAADLQPSPLWRGPSLAGQPVLDYTLGPHSQLLRSLAGAALRSGDVATALDCLHDPRLPPLHAVDVLRRLVLHLDSLSPETHDLTPRIMSIIARHIHVLDYTLPQGLLDYRASQLAPTILALVRSQYYDEAIVLVQHLQSPLQLPSEQLMGVVHNLLYHRRSTHLVSLFQAIPAPQRSTKLSLKIALMLLRTGSELLSDTVWEDVIQGHIPLTATLINARLSHHVRDQARRYRRALLEYDEAQARLSAERGQSEYLRLSAEIAPPTVVKDQRASTQTLTLLLDLHVKAGREDRAFHIYDILLARSDRPSDLLNHVLPLALRRKRAGNRPSGLESRMNRINAFLAKAVHEDGLKADAVTANIILKSNLQWGEMDNAAIWAALENGIAGSAQVRWSREILPLFKMVIRTFRERGSEEDAEKAEAMLEAELEKRRADEAGVLPSGGRDSQAPM